jgi:hypothetical protein
MEPALFGFIRENLAVIAGKMALVGVPTEIIQGVHEDTHGILLTAYHSVRLGHYDLWMDTMAGTLAADLDPTAKPQAKRSQNKATDGKPVPKGE